MQHLVELLAQQRVGRGFGGRGRVVVGNEVAEVAVLFLADRGLERDRVLRYLHDFANLVRAGAHLLGYFLCRRFAAVFLQKLARIARNLVYGFDHVDGDSNRSRLISYRAGDRLTNPPGRVGREFVALVVVELVDRLHQTEVALLDKIEEEHTLADIALGYRHDETEVGFHELLFRFLIAVCHLLGEHLLLVVVEQRHLADFLEVHTHRVVYSETLLNQHFLHILCRFVLLDLALDVREVGTVEVVYLDAVVFKVLVELVNLVDVIIGVAERLDDFARGQRALRLAFGNQLAYIYLLFALLELIVVDFIDGLVVKPCVLFCHIFNHPFDLIGVYRNRLRAGVRVFKLHLRRRFVRLLTL